MSDDEYNTVASNMIKGVSFLGPEMADTFNNNETAILKWATQIHLSPTPLERAAYTERIC